MSSEESNSDDDSVVVHPLKWRSETVNRMFDKMLRHMNEKKTSQAKHQMKPRTIGEPSKRQAPYTSDDYSRTSIIRTPLATGVWMRVRIIEIVRITKIN